LIYTPTIKIKSIDVKLLLDLSCIVTVLMIESGDMKTGSLSTVPHPRLAIHTKLF